jgi:hypothetical protein
MTKKLTKKKKKKKKKKLGTSIGFGTTTLALCDVVYTVGEASFSTPFMKLGKCFCSSIHAITDVFDE